MIRVFPRRTNATPIDPDAYIGGPELFDHGRGQEAHISCTFTWDKPECERLAEEWEQAGYKPILGGPAYDDPGAEFVPGKYVKRGYVITSRGCNNKCWFCYTWKREGGIRELTIKDGWNVLDSNLLQCSEAHVRKVFDMLRKQPEPIEFTGGLEAKLLTEWHITRLLSLQLKSMFFAYDTPDDYEPLANASRLLRRAGFTNAKMRCYVLIGYPEDTFEQAEKRLMEVIHLDYMPMAMLYRDNTGGYDSEWRRFQRSWARPAIMRQYFELRGSR